MSAKRSRNEQSCNEEILKIKVIFPKDKDEWGTISPEKWQASLKFKISSKPTLYHVWSRMKNWKICQQPEGEPLRNLDLLLQDMESNKVYAFPWTAEDKSLEDEMNYECDKRSLAMIDEQIDVLAKAIEKREKARQVIRARISKFNR
jgi:hypothetical protein